MKFTADPAFVDALLERMGQAAVLVVDPAGHIVYLSKRAGRLLNLTEKKALHKSFFDVIELFSDKQQKLSERKNPVWQALQKNASTQIMPFFCYLGDVPVAVRAMQIKHGRKLQWVVIEMRAVKRQLNVGEMKSLFVSFAAHQLKTPSSIVKGFLELMLRQGKDSYEADQWHNLQSAFEANENLIALSKTLLNLTRLEGGLIEPKIAVFDPGAVLRQKLKDHNLLIKVRGVTVKLQTAGRNSFLSDETFFSEICEILLGNALKYAPPNSVITLHCKVNNHELQVEVHDQGPGIPKEKQSTLFNTASDTNPGQNSHGLGLLMAKKYVSLLGGTLGLIPHTKKGAAFYFVIPKPII